jgi:hypothetical protein
MMLNPAFLEPTRKRSDLWMREVNHHFPLITVFPAQEKCISMEIDINRWRGGRKLSEMGWEEG